MMAVSDPVDLLAGFGPLLLGMAVLAALRILSDGRGETVRDVTQQALHVIGWVMLVMGALALVTRFFGLVICVIAVVVVIQALFRRRRAEQRAFVALLAATAERLMPLAPALEAFAREYRGTMGSRAHFLAERLRAGDSLPTALRACPGLVPPGTLPLVQLGYETGNLAVALREAIHARSIQEPIVRGLRSRSVYLFGVVTMMGAVFSFCAIKIAPALSRICQDFGAQMPLMTRLIADLSHPLALVFLLVVFGLGLLALFSMLPVVGIGLSDLPGLRHLVERLDRAALLEALSLVAHGRYPLPMALRSLATTMRVPLRRRLTSAAGEIEAGRPLAESLLAHRLLGPADCALLEAAGRLGNLAWAMRELADSHRRRWIYWAELAIQNFYPLLLLGLGALIGLYVVGYFIPVVKVSQMVLP